MPERRYPEAHPDALSEEDVARSATSLRQLVDDDLADRRTPSRRHEGFDVELEELPDDRQ